MVRINSYVNKFESIVNKSYKVLNYNIVPVIITTCGYCRLHYQCLVAFFQVYFLAYMIYFRKAKCTFDRRYQAINFFKLFFPIYYHTILIKFCLGAFIAV